MIGSRVCLFDAIFQYGFAINGKLYEHYWCSASERAQVELGILVWELWPNPTKTNVEFIIGFVRYYYYM